MMNSNRINVLCLRFCMEKCQKISRAIFIVMLLLFSAPLSFSEGSQDVETTSHAVYIWFDTSGDALDACVNGMNVSVPLHNQRMLDKFDTHPTLVSERFVAMAVENHLQIVDLATKTVQRVDQFEEVKNIVRSDSRKFVYLVERKSLQQYDPVAKTSITVMDMENLSVQLQERYTDLDGRSFDLNKHLSLPTFFYDEESNILYFSILKDMFRYLVDSRTLESIGLGMSPQVISTGVNQRSLVFLSYKDAAETSWGIMEKELSPGSKIKAIYTGDVYSFKYLGNDTFFLARYGYNWLHIPRYEGFYYLHNRALKKVSNSIWPLDIILTD